MYCVRREESIVFDFFRNWAIVNNLTNGKTASLAAQRNELWQEFRLVQFSLSGESGFHTPTPLLAV